MSELLQKEVKLAPDCMGPEVEKRVGEMKPGDVFLLENLRFHKEEEKNDPDLLRPWPVWRRSTSMTPLPFPTGPTPRSKGSRIFLSKRPPGS